MKGMKPAISAALVGVLIISGTGQITAQTNSPGQKVEQDLARQAKLAQYREAITVIFKKRAVLRKELLLKKGRVNRRRYAQDIARFDTSACPKSFRIAWIDYVTAWQKLATAPSGLFPLVEIVGAASTGNVMAAAHGAGGLAKDANIKKQDAYGTFAAMAECQKIAIKYDAAIPPD